MDAWRVVWHLVCRGFLCTPFAPWQADGQPIARNLQESTRPWTDKVVMCKADSGGVMHRWGRMHELMALT